MSSSRSSQEYEIFNYPEPGDHYYGEAVWATVHEFDSPYAPLISKVIPNGTGTCTFSSFGGGRGGCQDRGGRYTGHWVMGLREGKGTWRAQASDGKPFYEGGWAADVKDGYGEYTYRNGDVYKGWWVGDRRDGKGSLRCGGFSGSRSNNDGYGNDGGGSGGGAKLYDGDWINDRFEGKGKMVDWEENVYVGGFRNWLKDGKGEEKDRNGKVLFRGQWKDGKCVEWWREWRDWYEKKCVVM